MKTIDQLAEQEINRLGSYAHATPVGIGMADGRYPKAVTAIKFIPAAFIAFIMLFVASAAHAGLPQVLTSESRDWDFIQSVGGMKVAVKGNDLVVECDVSGVKKVTVKPTMINSGIGVRKLKHKRDGNTILVTLVTCVIGKGISTTPKPVDLSAYPDGKYAVEYLDPDGAKHPVGKINIKNNANRDI